MLEPLHLGVINLYYYSFLLDIGKYSRKTVSHFQKVSEVKSLLMIKLQIIKLQYKINSYYKASPHKCLKSIQNKKNNIVAKNEEKDLPDPEVTYSWSKNSP